MWLTDKFSELKQEYRIQIDKNMKSGSNRIYPTQMKRNENHPAVPNQISQVLEKKDVIFGFLIVALCFGLPFFYNNARITISGEKR